jgi:hypothetical protein
MERLNAFDALALAQQEGRFKPGVLSVLEALAPFAHIGELDAMPQHIANLFPVHQRQEVLDNFTRASSAFRKAVSPKEEQ